jgi:hypothetical protein
MKQNLIRKLFIENFSPFWEIWRIRLSKPYVTQRQKNIWIYWSKNWSEYSSRIPTPFLTITPIGRKKTHWTKFCLYGKTENDGKLYQWKTECKNCQVSYVVSFRQHICFMLIWTINSSMFSGPERCLVIYERWRYLKNPRAFLKNKLIWLISTFHLATRTPRRIRVLLRLKKSVAKRIWDH